VSGIIVLMVVTPLVTAFLLSLTAISHKATHRTLMRIRTALSVSGLSVLTVLLLLSAPDMISGTVYTYTLGGWSPFLGIALRMDALSFLVASISVFVCFLGMFYSFSYMEHIRGVGKYDAFYFLMITGLLGVLLTRDIFNMYVFFEVLSISVYILITTGEKKENYKASLKYLVLGSLSSALFLFAVGIVYETTGSLNMDYVAEGIRTLVALNPSIVYMVFSLFTVSLAVKSGVFPVHFWLPDAHSMAPSPVSALLSGIVLKISVYAMVRLFSLFGPEFYSEISFLIAYIGVATVVLGTLLALAQKDLKRMLAYSSISQIGIIVTGIGIGTDLALKGALFHVLNHALMKSGLFLCAGVMIHQSRTRDISKLRLGSPGMAVSFVVLSLGIVGIPPLNGFVSKFIVCYGAVQANYNGLALAILAASLVSCCYYFRVIQTFFGAKKRRRQKKFYVPKLVSFPVYVLAGSCVILGLFPLLGLHIVELAVKTVGG
jgi:multicomponent Na+:H+ antiporter subunit D